MIGAFLPQFGAHACRSVKMNIRSFQNRVNLARMKAELIFSLQSNRLNNKC